MSSFCMLVIFVTRRDQDWLEVDGLVIMVIVIGAVPRLAANRRLAEREQCCTCTPRSETNACACGACER